MSCGSASAAGRAATSKAAFTQDRAAGKALASLLSKHVKANLDAHRDSADRVEDVTDALLATVVDGRRIDDDQIVSILRNWIAGEGTGTAGLSLLVLHLAERSDLQDRLRSDPALIPAAIEEILRADGPLVANRRTSAREVEIGDRTIPEGATLTLMWIAANRDPRASRTRTRSSLTETRGRAWSGVKAFTSALGHPWPDSRCAWPRGAAVADEPVRVRGQALRRTTYPSNGLAALPLRFS